MAQTGRGRTARVASIVDDRITGSRIAARWYPGTRQHLQPRAFPFARRDPKPSASYVVVVVLFSSYKWMKYYHYYYRIIQPGNGCSQEQGLHLHPVRNRGWDEKLHPLRQPRLGWMFAALVITALNSLFVELWFPSGMSPPLRAEMSALHRGTDSAIALSQGRGARHHRVAHLLQSTPSSSGYPHLLHARPWTVELQGSIPPLQLDRLWTIVPWVQGIPAVLLFGTGAAPGAYGDRPLNAAVVRQLRLERPVAGQLHLVEDDGVHAVRGLLGSAGGYDRTSVIIREIGPVIFTDIRPL